MTACHCPQLRTRLGGNGAAFFRGRRRGGALSTMVPSLRFRLEGHLVSCSRAAEEFQCCARSSFGLLLFRNQLGGKSAPAMVAVGIPEIRRIRVDSSDTVTPPGMCRVCMVSSLQCRPERRPGILKMVEVLGCIASQRSTSPSWSAYTRPCRNTFQCKDRLVSQLRRSPLE